MAKIDQILTELESEFSKGTYGRVGDKFLSVRGLAQRKQVSLKTAFSLFKALKEKGLIAKGRKNYFLNRLTPARNAADKIRLIGCVVTMLENSYFSTLVRWLEEAVHELGAALLVASSEYDFRREKERINSLIAKGVSGIFLCPWANESEEDYYRTVPVPMVIIGRKLKNVRIKTVMVNNQSAAQKVAAHLIEEGCDSFAYIGQNIAQRDERLFGFRAELAEQGRRLPERNIICTTYHDHDRNLADIEVLLDRKRKGLLGIFCYHDLFASRVMMLCHKKGIDIPGEVLLVGFDDQPIAEELSPPLTTVRYPIEAIAQAAAESLYARLRLGGKNGDACFYVNAELVVRESTRRQHSV